MTATVGIGPRTDQPALELSVPLTVSLPNVLRNRCRPLPEAAHPVGPHSSAARGSTAVELIVEDAP